MSTQNEVTPAMAQLQELLDRHRLLRAGVRLLGAHETISPMTNVQKFTLDPTESNQPISMPAGARLLSVQQQGSNLSLWAAVDPTAGNETRNFRVVATNGNAVDFRDVFVGTVGELHVFEYFS